MIEERIKELGYVLPTVPKPIASYIPGVAVNNMVFTAGQLPILGGELLYKGKVGKDITEEEAIKAAERCALNCLSIVKTTCGDLEKIESIVKLTVFVNSAEDYTGQPKVANGASDLMVNIFGDNGKHVRSAVGVSALPLNAAVEVELIAKLKD